MHVLVSYWDQICILYELRTHSCTSSKAIRSTYGLDFIRFMSYHFQTQSLLMKPPWKSTLTNKETGKVCFDITQWMLLYHSCLIVFCVIFSFSCTFFVRISLPACQLKYRNDYASKFRQNFGILCHHESLRNCFLSEKYINTCLSVDILIWKSMARNPILAHFSINLM